MKARVLDAKQTALEKKVSWLLVLQEHTVASNEVLRCQNWQSMDKIEEQLVLHRAVAGEGETYHPPSIVQLSP